MIRLARGIALVALGSLVWAPPCGAADGPRNPGFEDGAVGEVPKGWFANGHPSPGGYAIQTTDRSPRSGRSCAMIELLGSRPAGGVGNLLQSVDATPYRGKQVRLKAAVRTEGGEGRAQLWMRVDREGGKVGFFDNMHDRPIVSETWADYEIVGDVDADARALTLGVVFTAGTGRVFVDDVSLEILGPVREVPPEAAQPLMGRTLENLVAFARLYGYVRFFHPSDQAAEMDANAWCLFAIPGVGSAGVRCRARLARAGGPGRARLPRSSSSLGLLSAR